MLIKWDKMPWKYINYAENPCNMASISMTHLHKALVRVTTCKQVIPSDSYLSMGQTAAESRQQDRMKLSKTSIDGDMLWTFVNHVSLWMILTSWALERMFLTNRRPPAHCSGMYLRRSRDSIPTMLWYSENAKSKDMYVNEPRSLWCVLASDNKSNKQGFFSDHTIINLLSWLFDICTVGLNEIQYITVHIRSSHDVACFRNILEQCASTEVAAAPAPASSPIIWAATVTCAALQPSCNHVNHACIMRTSQQICSWRNSGSTQPHEGIFW